jgi:hypothetical protein
MPKLVLHVGAHKTGTTYLQSTFFDNRALLADHGIHYPDMGPNKAHHVLGAPWLDMEALEKAAKRQGGADAVWDAFLSTYSAVEGTVFLSSESFSRGGNNQVNIAELAQRLSGFEDIQVIYTLRDQAELAQSAWLQVSKTSRVLSVNHFVGEILTNHRRGGIWYDHNLTYDHLLQGFKPDQITLLDYSKLTANDGGIVGAFLDLLGCDLKAQDLTPAVQKEANVSPDALSFFVAAQLTMPEVPPQTLIDAVAKIILPDPAPRTIMLRRRQFREIRKHFARLNEKLEQRVQPFQPGFKLDRLDFPDTAMFRENLTEQHWIQIARLLYGRSGGLGRRPLKPNPKILTRILGK